MSQSQAHAVRNVVLVSNSGAGKTSLVEAMLLVSGTIPTMGSVDAGSTVSDFEPEEVHRRLSLSTSVAHFQWKQTAVNVIDTPGALSIQGEARTALRAADGVVIVVSPLLGVKTELLRLWAAVQELSLPALLFVNQLDKTDMPWWSVVEDCQRVFGLTALPLAMPLGSGGTLNSVADLLRGMAVRSGPDSAKIHQESCRTDADPAIEEARKRLVEGVAEFDDQLLERYLADGDLGTDDLTRGVAAGIRSGKCLPALCGSAVRNVGVSLLLDAMTEYLPSPQARAERQPLVGRSGQSDEPVVRQPLPSEPFSGIIFKTIIDPFMGRLSYVRILSGTLHADAGFLNATRRAREKGGHLFVICGKKYTPASVASAGDIVAIGKLKDTQTGDTICDEHHPILYPPVQNPRPVLSYAIEPKSKADVEKVSLGLHKLIEEDPCLEFSRNVETKEMVLSGMGQLHVDVAFEKLRRKYGVEVSIHTPKVPYKETIRTVAQAQGKYKKQTGGHGQYGDCWLQLTPLPRGKGFEFEDKIVGGAIPRNFIPAVEKGVVEALQEGVLAGFPVVDLRATVYDGSYHVVDSSELAFKIAASMGFKKAMEAAHPVLLEPIMQVEVDAPEESVGAVIGDLNSRRGRILNVLSSGSTQAIKALVPLAEILKYAPALNSITGGRGSYSMEFSSYEEVPREVAARIIEEHKAQKHAVAAS